MMRALLLLLAFSSSLFAQSDYERPPIDYLNAEVNDPVAQLERKLASGEAKLEYDAEFGYLKSLLRELDIPVSSQTLVFSKTSLQLRRISPRKPRSLYFNDDVYVGFCQKGDVLELAATDAKQGATFYTLAQEKSDTPSFVRDRGGCLSCHASSRTQGVPGYLVRSVFADASGRPILGSGTYTTDHTSDFRERWGGWYVTGKHGNMRHMGNTLSRGRDAEFDFESGANKQELADKFSTDTYLSPESDIVALMVLEHQTQMHNAIAAANYATRSALFQSYEMNELLERPKDYLSDSTKRRIGSAADKILEYLLFCDEFQLTDQVEGSTNFAKEFAARGVADSDGRSLRDFDLNTRLFRYRCSYLIYSAAFEGLPDEVRKLVLARLTAILEGRDMSDKYAHIPDHERRVILEILRDTLPAMQQIRLTQN